jgi:glycosyltransferase involved in cell wall biosynthesis
MTRFSLIIPALDSIIAQTFQDFEVLIVDDASSDTTPELIDEYARSDPRVVPFHLAFPRGAGAACNLAIERAVGEYLLFLDGDDVWNGESVLEQISCHLEERSDLDILMFDFVYYDFAQAAICACRRTSKLRCVVPEGRLGPFRLPDFPRALRTSWVPWNKAYRRSFVEAFGLRFPPGYYWDSLWTVSALVTAGSIAIVPDALVRYRCCRADSTSRRPDPGHFDIFIQYDRVLHFLDRHHDLVNQDIRRELHQIMTEFLADMGDNRGVIPPEMLDEFQGRRSVWLAHLRR